ncbi:MAG: transposase [Sulfurovum sp.]|nr:transposase [Sulfurovum sp.]
MADSLPKGEFVKNIEYRAKGKKQEQVKIYVNEIEVELRRDATKSLINEDGKKVIEKTSGEPIKSRLVVERIINKEGEIVAQWILLTNVNKDVSSETIGTWYYYRWKIESYFKLLKTAGFNLEKWQQQDPKAIFRRLLICSYACVLLWKLQQSNEENAETIKKFLVKISGRLMEWGKDYTAPALLAGLWNFLQMMDILTVYNVDDLFSMKDDLSKIMGIDFGLV